MLMSWTSLFKTKKPQYLWSFLTLFSLLSSGHLPKGLSVSWNTAHTLDTILLVSGSPGFWTIASVSNSGHVHSSWGLQKWLVEVSREMWEILSLWHLGAFLLPIQDESSTDENCSWGALLVLKHVDLLWVLLNFIPCSPLWSGQAQRTWHPVWHVPSLPSRRRGTALLHLQVPAWWSHPWPQDASGLNAKLAVSQQTQVRVKPHYPVGILKCFDCLL